MGMQEWLLIVLAIALIFGATRIPQLMRGMGQGIKEFKTAIRDDEASPQAGAAAAQQSAPAERTDQTA